MIKNSNINGANPGDYYEGIERDSDKNVAGPGQNIKEPNTVRNEQSDTEHGPGINPDGSHKKF